MVLELRLDTQALFQVPFVCYQMSQNADVEVGTSGKSNPWIDHVKEYRAKNPEMSWKMCLGAAAATYTPVVKEEKGEKKPNPWMVHIDAFKKQHANWKETMTYKELLVLCKSTYVKQPQ